MPSSPQAFASWRGRVARVRVIFRDGRVAGLCAAHAISQCVGAPFLVLRALSGGRWSARPPVCAPAERLGRPGPPAPWVARARRLPIMARLFLCSQGKGVDMELSSM